MSSGSTDCTCCGCDVTVYVQESIEREEAGRFCNYGCLAAHVDAENLTVGTTCTVPAEDA